MDEVKINEIADDIYWEGSRFDILTKSGCEDLAKTLYDSGYRKQVWHKVSDGDLPKKDGQYLCKTRIYGYIDLVYSTVYGFQRHGNLFYESEVIAWTELPEYKEK